MSSRSPSWYQRSPPQHRASHSRGKSRAHRIAKAEEGCDLEGVDFGHRGDEGGDVKDLAPHARGQMQRWRSEAEAGGTMSAVLPRWRLSPLTAHLPAADAMSEPHSACGFGSSKPVVTKWSGEQQVGSHQSVSALTSLTWSQSTPSMSAPRIALQGSF